MHKKIQQRWWDCSAIDIFFQQLWNANLENKIKKNKILLLKMCVEKFYYRVTKHQSKEIGKMHYDLGNDLFQAILDSRMNYSCGCWANAHNLEEAQHAFKIRYAASHPMTPKTDKMFIGYEGEHNQNLATATVEKSQIYGNIVTVVSIVTY